MKDASPTGPLSDEDCVFCAIVGGQVSAHLVSVDDLCVAFLSARPAARGHTLVVPRRHVETLWDADPETAAAVMRTSWRVAVLLRERLHPDGLTVRQNNGAASGQQVRHLHVHLVPRWHGDGTIGWPYPPEQPIDQDAAIGFLRTDDSG